MNRTFTHFSIVIYIEAQQFFSKEFLREKMRKEELKNSLAALTPTTNLKKISAYKNSKNQISTLIEHYLPTYFTSQRYRVY